MPPINYDSPPAKIDYATRVKWPQLNHRQRMKVWRDSEAASDTEPEDSGQSRSNGEYIRGVLGSVYSEL